MVIFHSYMILGLPGLDAVLAADGIPPPPGMIYRWRPWGAGTWEPGNAGLHQKRTVFLSSKVRVELRGFYSFLMFLEILPYFELRKMIIS